jgi:hypothetical protein
VAHHAPAGIGRLHCALESRSEVSQMTSLVTQIVTQDDLGFN